MAGVIWAGLTTIIITTIIRQINGDQIKTIGNINFTCPDGWRFVDSTCYLPVSSVMEFQDAADTCLRYLSSFAVVGDEIENQALANMTDTLTWESFWNGEKVKDKCKGYWDNNQPPSDVGEEDCAAIDKNGRWRVVPCQSRLPFFCMKPACIEGTFDCGNGNCLSNNWLCDGVNDCGNNLDEMNCNSRCTEVRQGVSGNISFRNYPNSADCTWTIVSPPGSQLALTFTQIRLEETTDYIEVRNGGMTLQTSSVLKTLSGNHDNTIAYTNNNMAILRFISDFSNTNTGFELSWTSDEPELSSDVNEVAAEADWTPLTSPFYPNTPPSGFRREWMVTSDSVVSVQIDPPDLSPEWSLVIYDGEGYDDVILMAGKASNLTSPAVYISTSNKIRIILKGKDTSEGGQGIRINVKKGCSLEIQTSSGLVESPGYKKTKYPTEITCSWIIRAPAETNRALKLKFIDFKLHDDGRDKVQVYDGLDSSGSPLFSFQGDLMTSPPTVRGGNSLFVVFTSSVILNNGRFKFEFSVDCSTIPESPMLSISTNDTSYGSEVDVTCDTGFTFPQEELNQIATVTFTCMMGGNWDKPRYPTCQVVYCGAPPPIEFGFVSNYSGNATYGSTASYKCYDGFQLEGTQDVECLDNGNWTARPSCSSSVCGDPPIVEHATRALAAGRDETSYGAIVNYTCNDGYEILGPPRTLCQRNTTWSQPIPVCVEKLCPLPVIAHSQALSETAPVQFGVSITVTCLAGYHASITNSTTASITCRSDQKFDSVICSDTNECENNPCKSSETCVNSEGSYTCMCNEGYRSENCDDIDECSDGVSGCDHMCKNTEGSYICSCRPGYTLFVNGSSGIHIKQGETGERSGDVYRVNHTCVENICQRPSPIMNGTLHSQRETFMFQDNITYICNLGYILMGSVTRQCQADGSWSGSDPVCKAATCPAQTPQGTEDQKKQIRGIYPRSDVNFGQQVIVECFNTDGTTYNKTRFCAYDASSQSYTLQGDSPVCPVVDCGEVENIAGLKRPTVDSTVFGASFLFECKVGATVTGLSANNDYNVTCQQNGRWGYGNLTCLAAKCPDPGSPGGTTQEFESFELGQVVRYSCDRSGFTPKPAANLTCIYNESSSSAHWDYPAPTCVDTTSPVFLNESIQTIWLNSMDAPMISPSAEDNSGLIVSMTIVQPAGFDPSNPVTRNTTVDYSAVDGYGNSARLQYIIAVRENIPGNLTCPESIQLEANSTSPSYNIMDFVTYSGGHIVTDLQITASLDKVGSVTYERMTLRTDRGTEATCAFVVEIVAKACYHQLTNQPENGRLSPSSGSTGDIFTVAECNNGYTFADGSTSRNYTCSGANKWTPALPIEDCLPYQTPGYSFHISVSLDSTEALFPGSPCVKNFSQLYNASLASKINEICPRSGQSLTDRYRLTATDINFNIVNVHLHHVTVTLRVDNNDGNTESLKTCAGNLNTQKQALFGLNAICVLNVKSESVGVEDSKSGESCEEGYSLKTVNARTQCLPCPKGTYYSANNRSCVQCPDGQYQDMTGQSSCKRCGQNQVSRAPRTRNDTCEDKCMNGFFSSTGSPPCKPCPVDTYWQSPDRCEICPDGGSTLNVQGATSSSQCRAPCSAGKYSKTGYEPCTSCPRNFYQNLTAQTFCHQCGLNETTDQNASSSASDCKEGNSSSCRDACSTQGTERREFLFHRCVCLCKKGYTGARCDSMIDFCLSNPCVNGATCTSTPEGFSCQCQADTECKMELNSLRFQSIAPATQDRYFVNESEESCKSRCKSMDACVAAAFDTGRATCALLTADEDRNAKQGNSGTGQDLAKYFDKNCTYQFYYDGDYCENDLRNDCETNNCSKYGVCRDRIGYFECVCPSSGQYIEPSCDRMTNLCAEYPCENGGTCTEWGDIRHQCTCPRGYRGDRCQIEIDECEVNPSGCLYRGQCVDGVDSYTCTCPNSEGQHCQMVSSLCHASVCNNGLCINNYDTMSAECVCEHPYENDTNSQCRKMNFCGSNPCNDTNTQECDSLSDGFRCVCKPGFEGALCQHNIDDCNNNPCVNGTCVDGVNDYSCNCDPGWTGSTCESYIDDCEGQCSSSSSESCEDLVQDYNCICRSGYTGKNCTMEVNECDSLPCQHGGECVDGINGFTCNCTAGWEGITCQTQKDSCGEISCQNDGQCFNLYETYFCSCQTGTQGDLCEQSPNVCSLIDPCTSRGTCQQSGGAATCNCTDNPDYTGVSCELLKDSCRIPGEACENGGQCVLTDPTGYTCQCSTGFSGSRCEIVDDVCDGKCPAGIECVKEGQMTYCLCPPTQVLAGSVCKDASSNFDLFLDGGLQSESVPSLPFRLSGDLTILFWVGYLRGTRSVYISDNEDDVQYFEMFEDLIKFASESDSFNATLEDKNLLTIRGQWDHVAVTWMSNGTYVVFVNGLRSSEGNFGFGISSTSLKRVRLDSSFTGYVSQITLWRSILTRSDIISVMSNSSFSPTGDLALEWTSGYKMTTGSRRYTPSSASQGKKLCDTNRVLSEACDESRAINKSAPILQSCPLGNIHNVSDQRVVEASTVIPKPSVASGLPLLSTLTDDVLSWGRYDIVYVTKDEAGNYGFCRFKAYIKERYICLTSEFPQQKTCGREAFTDFCPSGSEPSVAFPNILRCGSRGSFNLNSPLEPFVPPVCGETTDLRFALQVTLTYTASSLCTPFTSRAIESDVGAKIINNLKPDWPDLCPGTCLDVIQRSRCDANNVIIDLEFTNLPDRLRKKDGSISLKADEIFFTTVKESTDLDITDFFLRRNDVKVVLLPSCGEAVGQEKCVACGPGSYFDSSSGTCAYCPVGTYTETSSETSCTPCQEGLTTLRQGSNSTAKCVTMCQAGTFYEMNSCEYCPVGFYQAEKGKSFCYPCPPKKITSGNGTIATDKCFDDCPSGTELQDDASCKECPQGYYRTQSIDVKCQACSGGNTTEGPRTTSASGCNLPDCGPGHFINEARQCVECSEGFYQPIKWKRQCLACNESFTTEDKGSQNSSDCRYVCTEGTELSDPDTQMCTECREGTYRDSSLEQRFLPCQNCPDGFTTSGSRSSNITDCNIRICLSGSYRNETDNKCYPCGLGEYQPKDLRTECKMCRTNYTTVEEGSVNVTQCQFFCPDGYEISSAIDETCSVCPRGTYHSRGDGLFTKCQTCNESRTTEMVGSKESSDCNIKVCTSGQVYNSSQDECSDCPLDTYQPEPLPTSKTTCQACASGKGTKGRKTSSESECQNICPSGQQYNSSSNQCEDCPQGTWKDGTLLARFAQCTDCANENYTTSGPGAVSNDNCTVRNCEAGYHIVGDMCVPCGHGFYQPKRAQDTCFKCGQGMNTSSDTSKTQDDCTISCDAGEQGQNGSCSPCPADTYKNTSGFDTCQQCTGSVTSDTNRISCTLTFCDRGVGYEEENAKCVDCSKGFYKDTRGNFNCSACPKNYTTAGVGAKSFTECNILFCEPGLYDSGTSVCSPCPLGTYKSSKGPQPCTNCTANRTTASKGATSQTQCSMAFCEAGEYRADDNTCQKCAMGFYQENRGATNCTSCGINKTTKTEGSTKKSDCLIICGAGRYRSAPDTCTVCDIGQYQPETNKESCLNCSDGFTTQNNASERELDCVRNCPPGKFRQGETCQPCPVGKYQPITGATTCINCEMNMTTRTEGADSYRKCVPVCSPGQHLNETSSSCVKCPLGSYMESSGTELTCTPCPTDKTTQTTGATSPSDCNRDDCRPGYFINLVGGGCKACGQGSYQPLKSQTSCQKCGANRTTRLGVTTATSVGQCILDCDEGYERNLRNTEECIKCQNGRYRNKTLSDSCTFCPRGQTTVKEGATSCVDSGPEVATAPRLITLTVVVTFQLESCSGLNTELLKKRFMERILSLVIRQALRFPNLCVTGCTNIEIIDFHLSCGPGRRRRGTAGGTETATVKVVAKDVLPQIADVNNTIIRSTESLLEEVLGDDSVLTDNLKTSFGVSYESITSITNTSSGCVPGAVNQTSSECEWCPKGTRHSATSSQCEACPIGQYQDDLGQTSCKQCSGKLTTKNNNSQSKQDCVSVCTVNPNYCQNNGICRNDSAEVLWCQCTEKYTGDKCEIRLALESDLPAVVIGVCIGIFIVLIAFLVVGWLCYRRRPRHADKDRLSTATPPVDYYDYNTPSLTPRSHINMYKHIQFPNPSYSEEVFDFYQPDRVSRKTSF